MPKGSNTLDKIFYPKSIAIVGASTKQGTLSWEFINNLINYGYTGKIFPVNPNADSVHSIKSYKSISEIEDTVDLAVIMISRELVLKSIEECHRKNIEAVIVITAGFKEVGAEGAEFERQLVKKIYKYKMRLVGPNCMGLINTNPAIKLNGTFVMGTPIEGGIGFVSQSGALGASVLSTLKQNDIGLAQFISIGNKADVSGNTVLEYWADNPDVKVITVYLESFGKPRRFMELAREITKSKPVIVIKSAKTRQGMKAASSHTGALASSDIVVDALLEQGGVIRVNTIDEMFDIAKAFDKAKIPNGSNIGILTNAGGPAILAVDECSRVGLRVTELSKATQSKLRAIAPREASVFNPVDLLPPANAGMYAGAAKLMLADKNIDSLIVILGPPLMLDTAEIAKAICAAVKETNKTCMIVLMSQDDIIPKLREQSIDHPPIYKFPENAVRAISEMLGYKQWQETPTGEYVRFKVKSGKVRAILNKYKRSGLSYLNFDDVKTVLDVYGLPVLESYTAHSIEEILEITHKIKYPVVIKAMGKNLIHKSDAGGVQTDIHTERELTEAAKRILKNLKRHKVLNHFEYFLVQPYVSGGIETIMGVSKDENAGHLIMFGLGGIFVEIFKDVKFKLLPIKNVEAASLVKSIKSYELLKGVRGRKAVDIGYINENLLRLSQLAEDFPEFVEIDLNPFVFNSAKEECKILDARMRVELQ
jgi:acetyl coenzyme A synthetase (ADP forming)-like protein